MIKVSTKVTDRRTCVTCAIMKHRYSNQFLYFNFQIVIFVEVRLVGDGCKSSRLNSELKILKLMCEVQRLAIFYGT